MGNTEFGVWAGYGCECELGHRRQISVGAQPGVVQPTGINRGECAKVEVDCGWSSMEQQPWNTEREGKEGLRT